MSDTINDMESIKPIGGYFSLELNEGQEYHAKVIRLNAGRYALEYILKARHYKKVYIPYYICSSVLQPFKRLGVDYEFYHINDLLEPATELHPDDNEAVLYVNYFGLKNQYTETFYNRYRNTILDQTQAFYSKQGDKYSDKDKQCDIFYSCRKFFGVADGAYLYTNCYLNEIIPQDESFERIGFLMKRIDRSPQEAYADFQANDKALSNVGMRRMSKLTQNIMQGIDYSTKAYRRLENFRTLDEALCDTNRFKWHLDNGNIPLVYPYFVENGARIRQYLIDHRVFCARYWPNVLEWCSHNVWEYNLTENLVCIPIDQRYGKQDMQHIINLLNSYCKQ